MTPCRHCSAPIGDDAESCQFCGMITARGVAMKDARAAKAEVEAKERAVAQTVDARSKALAAQAEASKANQTGLLWAILGTILCCIFPIGPVVGLVHALRARGLGKVHGFTAPLSAMVVSTLGLGFALMMWVLMGVMAVKESSRKSELRKVIGAAETLDLKTACALTELELFQIDYQGFGPFMDFDCEATGALEVRDDQAVMRALHFDKSSKERIAFVACFQRNAAHWSVKQLRPDEDCDAPPPERDVKPARVEEETADPPPAYSPKRRDGEGPSPSRHPRPAADE